MQKYQTLKQYFGYEAFREGQEELIDHILSGKDTLGIMPTGAGKSICYQVPALLFPGITLIVSPLISLMNDQVRALKEAGVAAAYLNSSLTVNQFYKALDLAKRGAYKIIYVAPERLLTDAFLSFATQVDISMVTVDEAHCISQWGQDFRPSYLKIVEFIEQLPKRPVVSAFTATATKAVKEDIVAMLQMKQPLVLVTGFDRKNLYYEVRHPKNKLDSLFSYLEEHEGESGIIYCATRKKVEEVCTALLANGYAATKYHAGLTESERSRNQEDFLYDVTPVMVATNAFGMGIDKSNVRFVVHYNMPKNLESYYQEAGRAGRDGEDAECILLYHGQDVVINQMLINQSMKQSELDYATALKVKEQDEKRLKKMAYYCLTKDCLREYVLQYFGERSEHYCGNCGNCIKEYEEVDVSETVRILLGCIKESGSRYGMTTIIDVVRGAESKRVERGGLKYNSFYGALKKETAGQLRAILNMLILDNYLMLTEGSYPVLQMARLGELFLQDLDGYITMKLAKEEYEPKANYVQPEKPSKRSSKGTKQATVKDKKRSGTSAKRKTSGTILSEKEQAMFEQLRRLRLQLARKQGVPPYIIFSDKTLKDMCVKQPTTSGELLKVSGVGEVKLEKYGEEFLQEIRSSHHLG